MAQQRVLQEIPILMVKVVDIPQHCLQQAILHIVQAIQQQDLQPDLLQGIFYIQNKIKMFLKYLNVSRQPDQIFVTTPTTVIHGHSTPSPPYVSGPSASGNSGTGPSAPSGPDDSGEMIYGLLPPREETLHTNLYIPPSGPIPVRPNYYPSAPDATYIPPSRGGGSSTPTPATYGERIQSTIIKNNSGRDWFFGIGPGKI